MTSDLLERLGIPAEKYIPVRHHHTLDNVIKHQAVATSVFLAEEFITTRP